VASASATTTTSVEQAASALLGHISTFEGLQAKQA